MKYLLLTLLLFSLSGFGEPEVYEGELLYREGRYYKAFSLKPYSGEHIGWHKNGQLKEKGNYIDGKRDGFWQSYHENGQTNFRANYKDGKLHGLLEQYEDDGSVKHYRCMQNAETVDMSICKQ